MRSRTQRIMVLLAGASLLATVAYAGKPPGTPGGPPSCDATAVAAATAAIGAACPCAGQTDDAGNTVPWKNHGKYVRCVAQATKAAVAASGGALQRRCVKESVRCAARSTCGHADGFVNCTTGSSCSFRRSAAQCTDDGGVPGTGSCCAPTPIGSPSGAFLDGVSSF